MQYVSLQTAITLTEWSERTIRRRIADNKLQCAANNGDCCHKTMISFESIQPNICIPLHLDDIELIKSAEMGDAKAQNDLALLFLENDKPKSAVYWLELAAKQCADAMQLLGDCYMKGRGVVQDNNLAIMWIAKAASAGHSIAQTQIQSLKP
jgi:hypothetical protein